MNTRTSRPALSNEPAWAGATLSDGDYDFLCKFIYEHSRISLGRDKRVLVTSRLSKRLRELDLDNYGDYCKLLRSPAGGEELQRLIDRISTNHTHFFREEKHFDFMAAKLLPAWRANAANCGETFRVWSAASSTGEEPYTIAIHLAEHLAPAESGAWHISASDISTRVLDIARQGVYEADKLSGLKDGLVRKYFQKGVKEWEGHYRVKPDLRARLQFHHLNLLVPPYPFPQPFHLIFCRNVMIYFDRPTQETLVAHLVQRLVPGGYLFVGHSESLSSIKHTLKMVQPAIYQKPMA